MNSVNEIEKKEDILSFITEEESELHFKPLTCGLGFGKVDEKKEEFIRKKSLQRRLSLARVGKPLKLNPMRSGHGELAPFYDNNAVIPVPKVTEIPIEDKKKSEFIEESPLKKEHTCQLARSSSRVLAYCIDAVIIIFFMALTLVAFFFILNRGDDKWGQLVLLKDVKLYMVSIFVLYYLFYFTFMDSTESSSWGKSLLGIKVQNNFWKKPSVFQTLLRSIASLLDAVLLGLPCLFHLKEHLSETQVVTSSGE